MPVYLGLTSSKETIRIASQKFLIEAEAEEEFQKTLPRIVKILTDQWKSKVVAALVGESPDVPNFEGYLRNYTPQVLRKAINNIAGQIMYDGTTHINDFAPYYKKIVHEIRKREIQKEK